MGRGKAGVERVVGHPHVAVIREVGGCAGRRSDCDPHKPGRVAALPTCGAADPGTAERLRERPMHFRPLPNLPGVPDRRPVAGAVAQDDAAMAVIVHGGPAPDDTSGDRVRERARGGLDDADQVVAGTNALQVQAARGERVDVLGGGRRWGVGPGN